MISYQEIKTWVEEKENKQKLVYGLCFVLVFIIGFGAGRFDKDVRRSAIKTQTNYTTKPVFQQTATAAGGGGEAKAVVAGTSTPANCLVKGNPSSRIYHVQGGAFYKTLKSPQCFASEALAQAAGYRKSAR